MSEHDSEENSARLHSEKIARDKIDGWVANLAETALHRTGIDVRDLLRLSLGRVATARCLVPGAPGHDALFGRNDIDHIIDWLVSSKVRDEHWLSRLDEQGRPLKLMKFGSIEAMVSEADKAMRRWRNDGTALASDGSDIVADVGDGWRIVELRTAEQLDSESARMGHCIGNGAYDAMVEAGETRIFSLRDRFDKSHMTIEVDVAKRLIAQVQGKGNSWPRTDYLLMLGRWNHGLRYGRGSLPTGFVGTRSGMVVEMKTLRPGDVVDGHVEVELGPNGLIDIGGLPDDLTVDGDLVILNSHPSSMTLERLPQGLVVTGSLAFKNLVVDLDTLTGRTVRFDDCLIDGLPSEVGSECLFYRCAFTKEALAATSFNELVTIHESNGPRIATDTVFEKGLKIEYRGYEATPTRFPDGYVMASPLSLSATSVDFGRSLSAMHGIIMVACNKTTLPTDMTVRGDLQMEFCSFLNWPARLVVGGVFDTRDVAAGQRWIADTDEPGHDERFLALTNLSMPTAAGSGGGHERGGPRAA